MSWWQAVFLGAVQGVTEFFPISSTAHLILLPKLFGWTEPPLFFDAGIHLATGLAILIFFRHKILEIITQKNWRLVFYIILAAVPAGLAGLVFGDLVEERLRIIPAIIFQLLFVSGLMWWAERRISQSNDTALESVSFRKFVQMGLAQILALIPGSSRSGVTISVGMLGGLSRSTAAEASFLIGLPVIFGAGIYESYKHLSEITLHGGVFGLGFLTALVIGMMALRWLMHIVQANSLKPFIYYRLFLALSLYIIFLS
ncbi:MAG: undecaprenyl-diphosphate phosphatase [bacterium]|nr:undecaprenyl-diphosphate phosphatase [bacterium]